MNSQIYLNPERLSILSIPRDKVWIFASPILQLLSQEARRTPHSSFHGDESESEDSDESDEESESDEDSKMTASYSSNLSDSKKQITRQGSKTDNSSKNPPLWSSAESLTELNVSNEIVESDTSSLSSKDEFSFFHIAYTPAECTIISSRKIVSELFSEPLRLCEQLGFEDVILIGESFLSLQVDIEGEFNNSAKILELTRPLSQHNISLFFLSNHFSNIVLIPHKFQEKVIEILTNNNFEFSDVSNSYIMSRPSETEADTPGENAVSADSTFEFLRKLDIEPKIHRKTKLLLTGARPGEVKESIIKASQCIAANKVPEYFAITRSSYSEVSLILPGSCKKRASMGFDFRSTIGSNLDAIIPMTVDLTKLPLDSTGIVAGFANSLLESMKDFEKTTLDTFEMNYLSMARSAVIMIPQENLAVVTKMVKNMKPKST